jgi:asparagine synthase (glutamine-hydrolysing)
MPAIIQRVQADCLTYLDESALHDLHDCVTALERESRQGALIEAGCALGGSAIVIAAAKSKERPLFVYDVFGMIPPPSQYDGPDVHARYATIQSGRSEGIGGNKYYGYEDDLLGKVKENFRRNGIDPEAHNVHLLKGLFEETLQVQGAVALAHIDGDWYNSVLTCLRRIEPYLVPGGVLVIDDYDDWSGCRKAVDEYFADRKGQYQFLRRSRLHVVRAYSSP